MTSIPFMQSPQALLSLSCTATSQLIDAAHLGRASGCRTVSPRVNWSFRGSIFPRARLLTAPALSQTTRSSAPQSIKSFVAVIILMPCRQFGAVRLNSTALGQTDILSSDGLPFLSRIRAQATDLTAQQLRGLCFLQMPDPQHSTDQVGLFVRRIARKVDTISSSDSLSKRRGHLRTCTPNSEDPCLIDHDVNLLRQLNCIRQVDSQDSCSAQYFLTLLLDM